MNPVNPVHPVSKPRKIIVPLAEARHWRAAGRWLFQVKMDGCFAPIDLDGFTIATERMRDGTHYAHTLLGVPGQSLQNVNLRETMPELRRLVPILALDFPRLKLCPEFSGGEGLEAVLAAGHEGGLAKDLDASYGRMYACKRVQTFQCIVTARDEFRASVTLADAATGQPRGQMPLRSKFDLCRIGSVLKVEAYGLTAKGLLREARPDKDTPSSWLVKF